MSETTSFRRFKLTNLGSDDENEEDSKTANTSNNTQTPESSEKKRKHDNNIGSSSSHKSSKKEKKSKKKEKVVEKNKQNVEEKKQDNEEKKKAAKKDTSRKDRLEKRKEKINNEYPNDKSKIEHQIQFLEQLCLTDSKQGYIDLTGVWIGEKVVNDIKSLIKTMQSVYFATRPDANLNESETAKLHANREKMNNNANEMLRFITAEEFQADDKLMCAILLKKDVHDHDYDHFPSDEESDDEENNDEEKNDKKKRRNSDEEDEDDEEDSDVSMEVDKNDSEPEDDFSNIYPEK